MILPAYLMRTYLLCVCVLEMRNTEQLLKSIGLMAYKIGSLDECNNKLKEYGPENVRGDRIKAKLKSEQTTAVERNNIFQVKITCPIIYSLTLQPNKTFISNNQLTLRTKIQALVLALICRQT